MWKHDLTLLFFQFLVFVFFLLLRAGRTGRLLVSRHLLVSHLEQFQAGLLEVADSLLDVLGVHLVLVFQLLSHLSY